MNNELNEANNLAKKTDLKRTSYWSGIIGAILGAIIGAVPWAIAYYFGWFVGWLGFLIGISAVKGYSLFRGKFGWPTVFIIVFTTIFGVAAGQMFGDFIEIGKLIANGEILASYADIPSIYFYTLSVEPEMLSSILLNFGLGLVFAALGVWRIIKNMIVNLKENSRSDTNQINSEPTPIDSEQPEEKIEM